MNDCAIHRENLRRMLPDGFILLSGGTEVVRNNDVNYVFRQHSDFIYLTGVLEPNYHLLLDPKRHRDTLFIPRVDAIHRVWLGHVPGPAEARRIYGIPRVRYADDIPALLRRVRRGYRRCYADRAVGRRFRKALRGLENRRSALLDALQTLRAVKTPREIERIQRAGAVTAQAHLAVMAATRPGMREYELQAEFERVCVSQGLRHQAYPPIFASGKNGAVLHYTRNDAVLRKGELFLVDAGAECEGYAGDITRTFPVGGRFSRRQRDIYSIVLDAQKQCTDRARAGVLSCDVHLHSMRVIADGLRSLGLMRGVTDDLVMSGAVRLFYPHGLCHMLGLDVHDCQGGRKRRVPLPPNVKLRFNARLEPGFVLTMEPGIYFNPALFHDPQLRRKHRRHVNFSKVESYMDFGGVRIEDNVVIRPSGPPLNLTAVPKEMDAVEAACGR